MKVSGSGQGTLWMSCDCLRRQARCGIGYPRRISATFANAYLSPSGLSVKSISPGPPCRFKPQSKSRGRIGRGRHAHQAAMSAKHRNLTTPSLPKSDGKRILRRSVGQPMGICLEGAKVPATVGINLRIDGQSLGSRFIGKRLVVVWLRWRWRPDPRNEPEPEHHPRACE